MLSYSWYFSITWLPTYLKEARHLDPTTKEFAILAGLPLFLGGIGCLFSGFYRQAPHAAHRQRHGNRRLLGCVGFLVASSLSCFRRFIGNPVLAVVALAFASFSNDLVMPGSWGACMDVGGRDAGTLSGTMNMMGNLGGAVASAIAPYILRFAHDDWNMVLYTAAGVYFIGTFFWIALDPVTPIDSHQHA